MVNPLKELAKKDLKTAARAACQALISAELVQEMPRMVLKTGSTRMTNEHVFAAYTGFMGRLSLNDHCLRILLAVMKYFRKEIDEMELVAGKPFLGTLDSTDQARVESLRRELPSRFPDLLSAEPDRNRLEQIGIIEKIIESDTAVETQGNAVAGQEDERVSPLEEIRHELDSMIGLGLPHDWWTPS